MLFDVLVRIASQQTIGDARGLFASSDSESHQFGKDMGQRRHLPSVASPRASLRLER